MTPTTDAAAGRPRDAHDRFGLACALVTPAHPDGSIDVSRLVRHARRVLDDGCVAVALFGTTGEGASVGLAQRERVLDAVLAAGIRGPRLIGGVMASAVEDAAAQANQFLDAGARGLLVAPPFYFKGVGEEGLYAWHARFLERCREPRGIVLYHLPSVTAVPLPSAMITRLKRAFPGVIGGIKDSSGDWASTERFLRDHPDLHVLVGDERMLPRAMREGGSGAINGFSNFCTRALAPIIDEGRDVPGIHDLVDLVLRYPVTPAIKVLVAHVMGDEGYRQALPPLATIGDADAAEIVDGFRRLVTENAAA